MRAELFIAWRQLWHRKLLNGIAVLGVTLGVLTLIAITGIMRGFQTKFLDTVLQISPHVVMFDTSLGQPAPVVDQLLGGDRRATRIVRQTSTDRQRRIARPGETVAAIRALPGVIAAAPLVVGSAVASAGSKTLPVELRGIDPAVQDAVTPLRRFVVAGGFAELGGAVDGAMIGYQLAAQLGVGVGDSLGCVAGQGERFNLRVVALFDTGVAGLDKGRVYVPTRLAQTILGRPDVIDRIELRLVDPDRAPGTSAQLEALFGYDAESWQETNASMLGVFDQQNLITGLIIGAVLVVGGFDPDHDRAREAPRHRAAQERRLLVAERAGGVLARGRRGRGGRRGDRRRAGPPGADRDALARERVGHGLLQAVDLRDLRAAQRLPDGVRVRGRGRPAGQPDGLWGSP